MEMKQFAGPFNGGPLNLGIGSRKIVQIGIERPHMIPISEEGTQKIILNINGLSYTLGDRDVLEFENLYSNNITIVPQETNNPYLIINVSYE